MVVDIAGGVKPQFVDGVFDELERGVDNLVVKLEQKHRMKVWHIDLRWNKGTMKFLSIRNSYRIFRLIWKIS